MKNLIFYFRYKYLSKYTRYNNFLDTLVQNVQNMLMDIKYTVLFLLMKSVFNLYFNSGKSRVLLSGVLLSLFQPMVEWFGLKCFWCFWVAGQSICSRYYLTSVLRLLFIFISGLWVTAELCFCFLGLVPLLHVALCFWFNDNNNWYSFSFLRLLRFLETVTVFFMIFPVLYEIVSFFFEIEISLLDTEENDNFPKLLNFFTRHYLEIWRKM